MPKCQKCEKETNKATLMLYANEEKLIICPDCFGAEEVRADMEYERQREEGMDLSGNYKGFVNPEREEANGSDAESVGEGSKD